MRKQAALVASILGLLTIANAQTLAPLDGKTRHRSFGEAGGTVNLNSGYCSGWVLTRGYSKGPAQMPVMVLRFIDDWAATFNTSKPPEGKKLISAVLIATPSYQSVQSLSLVGFLTTGAISLTTFDLAGVSLGSGTVKGGTYSWDVTTFVSQAQSQGALTTGFKLSSSLFTSWSTPSLVLTYGN